MYLTKHIFYLLAGVVFGLNSSFCHASNQSSSQKPLHHESTIEEKRRELLGTNKTQKKKLIIPLGTLVMQQYEQLSKELKYILLRQDDYLEYSALQEESMRVEEDLIRRERDDCETMRQRINKAKKIDLIHTVYGFGISALLYQTTHYLCKHSKAREQLSLFVPFSLLIVYHYRLDPKKIDEKKIAMRALQGLCLIGTCSLVYTSFLGKACEKLSPNLLLKGISQATWELSHSCIKK